MKIGNDKHIISTCIISKNIVVKNKEAIFSTHADNTQSFLLSVYQYLQTDYPKFYKMDKLSKLGWLASEVLLKDELIVKETESNKIGIVLTNANSSLDTDEKYFLSTKEIASPALFVYTLPNIVIGEICIRNKFKGENSFFVFDQFNAKFLKQYVEELFRNNIVQLCICGWVDMLNEDYKAVLFLIGTNPKQELLFTEENMDSIFKSIA
ncbi:MAG: hypothetical protein M3R72_12675 [Bacteroidota bacterium]|nr:hypothetical protein [Bacteroidota bacterium]